MSDILFWILIVVIVFLTVIIIIGYSLISDILKMFIELSAEVDSINKEIDKLRKEVTYEYKED